MTFVFFGDPGSINWGEWEKSRVKARAALDARWVALRDYLPAISRLHATLTVTSAIDGALVREALAIVASEVGYSHNLTAETAMRVSAGQPPPPVDSDVASGPTVAERIQALESELLKAREELQTHEFLHTTSGTRVCGSCGLVDGSGQPHSSECRWSSAMGRK